MVKLFLLFLLNLQTSCFSMSKQQYEISDLDYTSNQVIVNFAKKVQKKGLYACGLGGREDKGKVMDFDVTFQYGNSLDIPAARKLIVETILLFVEEINNNEAVRNYLYHYPFMPEDVIVSILPDCSKLSEEEDINFVRVSAYLGKISYYDRQKKFPLRCFSIEKIGKQWYKKVFCQIYESAVTDDLRKFLFQILANKSIKMLKCSVI